MDQSHLNLYRMDFRHLFYTRRYMQLVNMSLQGKIPRLPGSLADSGDMVGYFVVSAGGLTALGWND